MRINWKLRLKNRQTLAALAAAAIGCAYQIMGILGIVSPISQDVVLQLVGIVLNVLVAVGVVIDPTTQGASDSKRAMGYDEPYAALDTKKAA